MSANSFLNSKNQILVIFSTFDIMTKQHILIFLLALVFSNSCKQGPPSLTDEQKGTLVMEIKETLDNYYADIKSGGLIAEFKYLDSTKDFSWMPPGYTKPISFDSVACILKANSGNYKEIDNSFENLNIEVLCEDSAVYSGKIRSIMTDTTNTPMTIYLNEKGKLIKRKDGWKLLNGETTISLSGK